MNERASDAVLLGAVLRRRRKSLGLLQGDLADLAGTSQRFVHSVEAGKATVQLDKLLAVLEVLGLGLAVVPGHGEITAAAPEDGAG